MDIAMATTFWLPSGYNFGCVVTSNSVFDSSGFTGSSCPMET